MFGRKKKVVVPRVEPKPTPPDPIEAEMSAVRQRLARLERLTRPEPEVVPEPDKKLDAAALESELRQARRRAELAELQLKEQQALAKVQKAIEEAKVREQAALAAIQAAQQPPAQ